MQRLAGITFAAICLLAGCAHVKPAAPSAPPASSAPSANTSAPRAPPAVMPPPAEAPPPVAQEVKPQKQIPAVTTQQVPAPKPTVVPRAKAKPAAPPPPSVAAAAAPAPAPAAAPAKPQLDFNALETRLRNTSAIGVFTKLSLKNQVDDLLKGFRGYYAGQVPPTLDDLRQRYDGLLLKVVTLVQDGDASLASAISASRGAIWERLSNRESFQAI